MLSDLIATRRGISPMTASALEEPRRGSSPPKDTHLRQTTMLPMPLPACRTALSPQLHPTPHWSSLLTMHHQSHNEIDTYLEEMPKNAGNTNVPLEPVTLAHIMPPPSVQINVPSVP